MRGRIIGGIAGVQGAVIMGTWIESTVHHVPSRPRGRVSTGQGARTPRTQSDRAQAGQHAAAPPHRATGRTEGRHSTHKEVQESTQKYIQLC